METGEKQRLFCDLTYGALSWGKERRVIVKAEHTSLGPNTRYIVTTLSGDPQELYDKVYCHRGEMETGSRNSRWICLLTEPPVVNGGPTNLDFCSQVWLTCLWKPLGESLWLVPS